MCNQAPSWKIRDQVKGKLRLIAALPELLHTVELTFIVLLHAMPERPERGNSGEKAGKEE